MKLFRRKDKTKAIKNQSCETKTIRKTKLFSFKDKKKNDEERNETKNSPTKKKGFFIFKKKSKPIMQPEPIVQPKADPVIYSSPINKTPSVSRAAKTSKQLISPVLLKRLGIGFGALCVLSLVFNYVSSPDFRYRNYSIEPKASVVFLEIGDTVSKDLLDYLELPDDFPVDKITITKDKDFNNLKTSIGDYGVTYEYNGQTINLVFDVKDTTAPSLAKTRDILLFENQSIGDISEYLDVEDKTDVKLDINDQYVQYDTPGEYSVTVTATDSSGNSSDIVVPLIVEELNLKTETPYLQTVEGDTSSLLYTSNSKNDVVYSDYDKSIVSISNKGVVHATSAGTTTVVGTIEGQSVKSTIEVVPAYLYLNYSNLSLIESGSYSLTATTNSKTNMVTFTTSNTGVVKVNSSGELTAVKEGEATIYAKVNGKTAECKVTVKPLYLEFSKKEVSIYQGNSGYVSVSTNSPKGVTYSSSNKSVATVDEWGNIYGAGVGTAVITVSSSGKKDTVTVSVSQAPAPVSKSTSSGSATGSPSASYVINTNTGRFHHSWCGEIKKMKDKNKWYYEGSRDEIVNMGYVPCKKCNP